MQSPMMQPPKASPAWQPWSGSTVFVCVGCFIGTASPSGPKQGTGAKIVSNRIFIIQVGGGTSGVREFQNTTIQSRLAPRGPLGPPPLPGPSCPLPSHSGGPPSLPAPFSPFQPLSVRCVVPGELCWCCPHVLQPVARSCRRCPCCFDAKHTREAHFNKHFIALVSV